jgi:hypothetical protein
MRGYVRRAGLVTESPGAKKLGLCDAERKRQEMRYAPFLAAFAGMTSGAALFAAGIAFARIFWAAP